MTALASRTAPALRRDVPVVGLVLTVAAALLDVVAVVAPSLVVAAARGGVTAGYGVDLVAGSAAIGLGHAVVVVRRLVAEQRAATRRVDAWIAGLWGLLTLGLTATVLPVVVLLGFATQHAELAQDGFPVLPLWLGIQLTAVALAEATARWVFGFLQRPGES